MPYQDREHIRKAPAVFKTCVGLASGTLATSVVHPYDLLKTRMQLSNRNLRMVPLAKCLVKCEGGYKSLYKGLTAALARNVTNTSVRLGAYYTLSERYRKKYQQWPSLYDNIVIGVASGALGAFSGTPAEVVLVRMVGDGKTTRPGMWICDRYKGVFNGINKIIKTDGVPGLWRGGLLTLLRSVMVSTVHIYCYKKTHKHQMEYYASQQPPEKRATYKPTDEQNIQHHFVTSIVASFFTSMLTLPVDLVKTRYQFVRRDQQMNAIEVLKQIVRTRGIMYFWKGFIPYYFRMCIHTIITFIILDHVCKYYVDKMYHEQPSMGTTVAHGVLAGMLGAMVGNPFELVLVRMMGDGTQGRSTPCMPVRYKNVCDGIKHIMACEGNLGLWRGAGLSVLRSAIISSSQIYTYTKTKQNLLDEEVDLKARKKCDSESTKQPKTGSIMAHLVAAMVTSFYTAILTLPVDLVKTWYQYMNPDPCCSPTYILKSLIKCRSTLFLWKGFLPYYLRLFTHTFITFLLLDKLCSAYETGSINPFRSPESPRKWTPWSD